MSDSLSDTANETIRVPRNLMGLLRQSYDSREKMLDWLLAIAVAVTLAFLFRDQIMQTLFAPDPDPNAGRDDPPVASQNVDGAIPPDGNQTNSRLYTYNMPVSRAIRYQIGPTANKLPEDPSRPPTY